MKTTKNNEDNVLLKVRNVKKFFNTPSGVLKAIDDVSFDVKPGEIIGLIGESGSGKTTVGRCLIRLYDQYSGLVSFNGEVISGTKLSKRQKRFLNQHIQMIFQDPHASLNPQHNIYTILKEPLIVNKIMKNEYKDFFSDWLDVTNNFRYSFLEYAKKIELDNAIYHTQQASQYLKEWTNILNRIKFKYEDVENDFNQYFSYLLSDQQHESNVISKMFDNNTKLLDFYFKSQNEYRQGNILFVEKELKEAREKLDKTIKFSNKSIKLSKIKEEIALFKKLKKDAIHKYKEDIKSNLSIINSYLKEFQNDYQSNLDTAHSTTDYIVFNKYIKNYFLYKKVYDSLKKVKHEILYIDNFEFDKMITKLKHYKDDLLIEIESKLNERSLDYKNEVKQYIHQNFNFSFESEIASSKQRKSRNLGSIESYNEIIATKLKLTKAKFDDERSITYRDIENAKNEYVAINKENNREIAKFLIGFNKRMDDYQKQIDKKRIELESIREKIKEISELFEIKHKEFIEGLLNKLLGKKESPSKVKNIINSYESRVK